jgi:hypothetical protein
VLATPAVFDSFTYALAAINTRYEREKNKQHYFIFLSENNKKFVYVFTEKPTN